MLLKTLATANLLLALVTTGCGLAIHYKWVGEMEPIPNCARRTGRAAGAGDDSCRIGLISQAGLTDLPR